MLKSQIFALFVSDKSNKLKKAFPEAFSIGQNK